MKYFPYKKWEQSLSSGKVFKMSQFSRKLLILNLSKLFKVGKKYKEYIDGEYIFFGSYVK